jgi:predicted CoA-binding protein
VISQAHIDGFLKAHAMAIAGLSRTGRKFGNIAHKTLMSKGYSLYPIHPDIQELNGLKCYADVTELPDDIENLLLVVPPLQSELLVKQIPESPIKRVWMQQGAESHTAIKFCHEHNIQVVHGCCILMHAQPQGIHKFHHLLSGLFGKLPH